ncbi:MAG: polysaccharide biosynthesis C-terminal domain-containing protein [Lentisphaerota bacterium]
MHSKVATLKVFLWGSFVSLLGAVLIGVMNYLVRRYLANTFSIGEYGFLYAVFSLLTLLLAVVDLGMTQAGTILIAKNRAGNRPLRANSIYSFILMIKTAFGTAVFMILALLSSFLVINYYKFPGGQNVFLIVALLLIFQSAETVCMSGMDSAKAFGLKNLLQSAKILLIFLGIVLFSAQYGLTFAAGMFPACALLSFIAAYIILAWKFGLKAAPEITFNLRTFKHTWDLSRWIAVGLVGLTAISNMDSIMLAGLSTPERVGVYNIALPIVQIVQSIIILPVVFTPIVAELWQHGRKEEIAKLTEAISVILFILLWLALITTLPLAKFIITILFGPQFTEAGTALTILCAGTIFFAAASFYVNALNSCGAARQGAAIMLGGALFNIVCNAVLIPLWNINGAATATALSYLFICLAFYRALHGKIPMHIPFKSVLYIALAGIAVTAAAAWLYAQNFGLPIMISGTLLLDALLALLLTPVWLKITRELIHFYQDKNKTD